MSQIYSMTAYGSAEGHIENQRVTVELRSVNNRYLDISVRLPKNYMFAEDAIKKVISEKINRGKIDVFVTAKATDAAFSKVTANIDLAAEYYKAISAISEHLGLEVGMNASGLARFPDVLVPETGDSDPEIVKNGLAQLTAQALDEFNAMRAREGERMRQDILEKTSNVESMLAVVKERSPETVLEYRNRLENKIREVLADRQIDESRIIMEAAVFADKVAVDEETVRLASHIAQCRQMLSMGSPVGRKLDFLIQEFNREANTIGSKCSDAALAQVVVNIKSEIEKIREQVQNIE